MTAYSLTISPHLGMGEVQSAREQESHYLLEERFADFKGADNLNLPGRWTIQFTSDVAVAGADYLGGTPSTVGGVAASTNISTAGIGTGNSPVTQFEVTVANISNNVQLDPKNFEVK